jgi:hypothetical protein
MRATTPFAAGRSMIPSGGASQSDADGLARTLPHGLEHVGERGRQRAEWARHAHEGGLEGRSQPVEPDRCLHGER